ncbi:carboxypeptidase-like regulatory domain-containing protein [Dyella sp. 2RAB6]|uniref:carboxypeptidase-like regulatory domain-containing protein n=1 Tax=Dyella sp. 2RAB6 TaxID=3232992 RepID=UPI003F9253C0
MKTSQKTAAVGHRRYALKLMTAIAVSAFGAIAVNAAYAQSTSSSILGKSPADSTITVHSDKGITRHGSPNSKGRYNLSALPPGTYEVSLQRDGKTLATVDGIPLFAGRASEVDFACDNDQCTGSFNH